jgi:hypothetical protein
MSLKKRIYQMEDHFFKLSLEVIRTQDTSMISKEILRFKKSIARSLAPLVTVTSTIDVLVTLTMVTSRCMTMRLIRVTQISTIQA